MCPCHNPRQNQSTYQHEKLYIYMNTSSGYVSLLTCNFIYFFFKNTNYGKFKHKIHPDYFEKKHKLNIKMSVLLGVPSNPESSTYFQSYSDYLYFLLSFFFFLTQKQQGYIFRCSLFYNIPLFNTVLNESCV